MSTPSVRASHPPSRRGLRVSRAGLVFLIVGALTIGVEFSTSLIARRLGPAGHWAIAVCGLYFMLWGFTEFTAGMWPRLGSGGFAKHRFHLPAEGRFFLLIMIVLFVGSLLGRSNSLLLVFCCLAGPFVINGFMIVAMLQRLSVEREVPPRVMAGESFSVDIRLSNAKRLLPVWVMSVRDEITFSEESLDPSVLFVHVPRRGSQLGSYRLTIATRGPVHFGPVIVQSRFPLGIVERGLQFELPGRLLVYPRLGRLAANWRRLIEASHDATHSAAHVAQAAETFHRLRDYHSGDDPRTIHWRTSARRNELMVREFRDERDSPLVLLIDAWRPGRDDGTDEFLELALSFAATVCVQQLRSVRDAPVACAASGVTWLGWNGAFRGDSIEYLLDSLALLESSETADWKRLIEFAGSAMDRRQTTLLLTPRPELIRSELHRLMGEQGSDRMSGGFPRLLDLRDIKDSRIFSWT